MISALLYSRLISAARMVSGVVLRDKPGASVNARSSVRVSAAGEQVSASGEYRVRAKVRTRMWHKVLGAL